MKRIMTLCLLTLLAVGGVKAQKGMQQVGAGVNIFVLTNDPLVSIGPALTYQYNLSNYFRLEGLFAYNMMLQDYARSYGGVQLGANVHAFMGAPTGLLRPYGIVGAHYATTNLLSPNLYDSNGFDPGGAANAGLGLDYRVGYHFSMQLEAQAVLGTYLGFMVGLHFMYDF